jgi:flavin reductase (DIM6/NTAB) family NADH-FMN oxidoreductase RutF
MAGERGGTVPTLDTGTVPAGGVAADAFRELMSSFPTGVAVITSMDAAGNPHGLTCTSLSSVTLAPPTLLACLAVHCGTLTALRASGAFAVNLLHSRAREAALVFASSPTRFSRIAWRPAELTGAPELTEHTFAVAECRVRDTTVVGDHAIVLGEVLAVAYRSDTPLLYGLRQFATWAPG